MNPCYNTPNIQEKTEEETIVEKKSSLSSSTLMRVRPPTTSPAYLVFHHGKNERSQTFFSLSDNTYSVKSVTEMRATLCRASCQGWLVMTDNYSPYCFLLNPVTMEKIELPPLEHDDYYNFCVLTSSPHTPNCVVMFVVRSKFYCKFWRPGQKEWTNQDLKLPEEESAHNFSSITAATSCKENIYIIYAAGHGIAILDTTYDKSNGELFTIRRAIMGNHRECPDHPSCALFASTYLVESCEEVFLVRKHYKGHSKDVFGFSVFRLDFLTMDWEPRTNLGDDRVFLLDYSCCSSVSASATGVKENCIYFFEPGDTNLYKFRMDEETISNYLPCPNVVRQYMSPYWMLPLV